MPKVTRRVTLVIPSDNDADSKRSPSRALAAFRTKYNAEMVEDSGWTSARKEKAAEVIAPIKAEPKVKAKPAPKAEPDTIVIDGVTYKAAASTPEGDFFEEVIVAHAKSKTHECKARDCYKFGKTFSDKGWFGDKGKNNGHIHLSPAHRS